MYGSSKTTFLRGNLETGHALNLQPNHLNFIDNISPFGLELCHLFLHEVNLIYLHNKSEEYAR